MTPRLRAIDAPKPQPRPTLRRVTIADATRMHPNNPEHARLWLRAIAYLRTSTTRGWMLDRPTPRQEQPK